MDKQTKKYYSEKVKDAAELYSTAKDGGIQKYFSHAFLPGSRVLEIGAGTGRDLNTLLNSGYDAFGIDASGEMVNLAHEQYPALKDRYIPGTTPSDKPYFNEPFDSILCSAVLMHLPDELLLDAAYSIKRNLKQGGRLLISVPLKRPDLDRENRTPDGRLFILRPIDFYSLLFERLGFRELSRSEETDSLGRPGITWSIQTFILEAESRRSLDKIESILNRDRKTATYKLALFRALADIAAAEYNSVTWYENGGVGIPIQNIAEILLTYYWPLFENEKFIPQINGEEPGCKMPVKFRNSLTSLIDEYRGHGGLNRYFLDNRSGIKKARGNHSQVLKEISETIKKGPVVYSGGAAGEQIFSYDSKFRNVILPADIWKELCLMGHWIRDALILRWGELTSRMTHEEILPSEVINLLLRQPIDERDTSLSRDIFSSVDNLECV